MGIALAFFLIAGLTAFAVGVLRPEYDYYGVTLPVQRWQNKLMRWGGGLVSIAALVALVVTGGQS